MVCCRLIATLALFAFALSAQSPRRPRIGLVLEGGAALGFAHVGILEWLEENRIPIDAIAGTSMGGLMGGLYAAGYSPAEIRQIARDADWGKLLGGETAFQDLAYRRKEDKIAYPNRLELGLRNGLVLPAGFNEGHEIGLLFSRLLVGYPEMQSFDDLPTPFRCVATDLISGRMRVWDRGRLNEALRSTMSIPAVFSPLRKDGGVYVDGGLLDNLPVDIARQMGVDIVIAVHLNKGPVNPRKVQSLLDVMGRSISVVIGAAEMRTIEKADVVLVADLAKYATIDYGKSDEIAAVGRQAADAKARVLRLWSMPEAEYQAFQAQRQARVQRTIPDSRFVVVRGADARTDSAIDDRLEKLRLEDNSIAAFERELTQVVGLGRFASIQYNQTVLNGQQGLEVVLNRKPSGPIFVNPAIEINGVDPTSTRFAIGARITWLDFWGFRSEWRNDVWFGARSGVSSEVYKPIRPDSKFFLSARALAETNPFDAYQGRKFVSEYRLRNEGVWLDYGVALNRFAELRLGYQFNWIQARQRVGPPVLESFSLRRDLASLRFNYEGQDDAVVARRGLRINARLEYIPNQNNPVSGYTLAESRLVQFVRVSPQNSLILAGSGGAALGPIRNAFLAYSLGGPTRLGAYGANELLAREYLLATGGWLYEFRSQPSLFSSKLYFALLGQTARVRQFDQDLRYPNSATGVFLLKTLLGPVFVGASVGDGGHRRWFFGMGRFF